MKGRHKPVLTVLGQRYERLMRLSRRSRVSKVGCTLSRERDWPPGFPRR
jgi:hypothetical protein